MKNGVYRVTLSVDGRSVRGEAYVDNGVFRGLSGGIARMKGLLGPPAANEADGGIGLRVDDAAGELAVVRVQIDRMDLISLSDRDFAGAAAAYVELARGDLVALRARMSRAEPET